MPRIDFNDVIAAFAYIDDLDVLARARHDPALQVALESSRHPNWWGTGAGRDLLEVARNEGLPLAWVPGPEIIRLLAKAPTAEDRAVILLEHSGDILEECSTVLTHCTHAEISTDVALARRALEAVQHGFHEAGMALAVSMGEPLAAWASTPRIASFDSDAERSEWEKKRRGSKYKWAQIEIDRAKPSLSHGSNFTYQVLIAPIPRFFTSWRPESGSPRPRHLSRHVVAHQAALDHFTELNALLSILLVVGILREQQDWAEEMDYLDA